MTVYQMHWGDSPPQPATRRARDRWRACRRCGQAMSATVLHDATVSLDYCADCARLLDAWGGRTRHRRCPEGARASLLPLLRDVMLIAAGTLAALAAVALVAEGLLWLIGQVLR